MANVQAQLSDKKMQRDILLDSVTEIESTSPFPPLGARVVLIFPARPCQVQGYLICLAGEE